MKTFSIIFFAIFFSLSFSITTFGQSRTNTSRSSRQMAVSSNNNIVASKVKLKNKTGYKIVNYVPASKLKEGRNYIRFGKRRMFIAKRGQKVVSVKVMNPTGQWGPNVLGTAQQKQHFWCVGGICGCSGDSDCNDLFTTDLCGDDAVCVGDNCYCARD